NLTAQIGYAPFEAWSASENISSTRTAVGQYSAYYTVPPNIGRDAIVAFQASAANPGGGFGVGSPVYVEFPDPFLIWYRTVAIGEAAGLRFRLASGDVPVQGQNLFVYAQTWSQLVLAGRVTTDNNGRFEVRFTVPPDSVRIGISGNISGTWTVFHDYFSSM